MDNNNPEFRKYMLIAEHIREQINSGLLTPGSPLPSIEMLATMHSVAEATATKAVRLLGSEGFIRRFPGVGYFVASQSREDTETDTGAAPPSTASMHCPDPRPYINIVTSLEDEIRSGILAPGANLPSVKAICREYRVSRHTAAKALHKMQSHGLVYRVPGLGYLVASPPWRGDPEAADPEAVDSASPAATTSGGNGPRPHPHLVVAARLRDGIRSGALAPGSSLPSTRDICGAHHVAPPAAAQALKVLESEGLILRVPGYGFFVSPDIGRSG